MSLAIGRAFVPFFLLLVLFLVLASLMGNGSNVTWKHAVLVAAAILSCVAFVAGLAASWRARRRGLTSG